MSQFFLIGKVVVPLLTGLYCAVLLSPVNYKVLLFTVFMQCLESFCFYNSLTAPLLYLIPVTLAAVYVKKNLYPSFIHCIAFTLFCASIQIYAIESLMFGIIPTVDYAILKICGTIIVGICFFLTIKYWGKQDNRA